MCCFLSGKSIKLNLKKKKKTVKFSKNIYKAECLLGPRTFEQNVLF